MRNCLAEMKVYHCGNTLFYNIDLKKRIWNKTTHQNSGLGLFFDIRKEDYLINFGKYLYEIEIKNDANILVWNIVKYRDISQSFLTWEEAEKYGEFLSKNFDLILIEEMNGKRYQGIIINDKCVINCEVIDV